MGKNSPSCSPERSPPQGISEANNIRILVGGDPVPNTKPALETWNIDIFRLLDFCIRKYRWGGGLYNPSLNSQPYKWCSNCLKESSPCCTNVLLTVLVCEALSSHVWHALRQDSRDRACGRLHFHHRFPWCPPNFSESYWRIMRTSKPPAPLLSLCGAPFPLLLWTTVSMSFFRQTERGLPVLCS